MEKEKSKEGAEETNPTPTRQGRTKKEKALDERVKKAKEKKKKLTDDDEQVNK